MIITHVRTVLLTGPSTNDRFFREARKYRSAAFIEVHTDTDLIGIGETYAGYFLPESVPAIVEFFGPILVGQSPEDVEVLWERMYHCGKYWCRVGLGMAVLTGIEAALWDLRGKMHGVPVYDLLGGRKHDKLMGYATGGPSNYPLERLGEKIDYYRSLGFIGLKVGAGAYHAGTGWTLPKAASEAADLEASKLDFMREHTGPDFQIMLDGHMDNSPKGAWTLDTAIAVAKALEPYGLFFLEEPLPYTDPWSYSELARQSKIPIAGGECLTSDYEWRVFAELDCFDIGQPDASFTGGLSQFMKVSQMLEKRGRAVATHAWGAGGSLMQNVHCGFAAPNTAILEIAPDYGGLHAEVIDECFVMENGYVLPPEKPGLGIVLTDAVKSRYPFVGGSGEFNSVPGKMLLD